MERGSAKGSFVGSPMKAGKQDLFSMQHATTNKHSIKPTAELLKIDHRSSARKHLKKGINKGKVNLGINYEGIELGASNLTQSPNKTRLT